jgi:peptide-methionine (S)-S-oxide reductase
MFGFSYLSRVFSFYNKILYTKINLTVIGGIAVGQNYKLATFAGGCFWCMVKPFDEQPGIISVISGYTGGTVENPTYQQVCSDTTGHYEAVQITYDPDIFKYETLLELFWQQIDPTDSGGQFYDRGQSYQTAIFYHDETQKNLAEASKEALQASGRFNKPIVTPIFPAKTFYPAEEYHQHYYKKNRAHYEAYQVGSGRKGFIQRHWGGESEK